MDDEWMDDGQMNSLMFQWAYEQTDESTGWILIISHQLLILYFSWILPLKNKNYLNSPLEAFQILRIPLSPQSANMGSPT